MSVNIELLQGSENFPGMQSKVWMFVVPSRAFPSTAGEVALFAAAKTGQFGVRSIRAGARIMAAEGAGDSLGWFTQASYTIPEGVVLKLFAMRKLQTDAGPRACALFLQPRADAALTRFAVDLTGYHRATMRQAWVEGRFDVISKHDAVALGVKVNPLHERQFNPAVSDLMIRRTEMAPALRTAVVADRRMVTNTEGEKTLVTSHRRKRSIEV